MNYDSTHPRTEEAAICPSAPFRRRAVIDVGTNSVKLLVADVGTAVVQPVLEKSEQTRLGRGFYKTRLLQPDAIAHTARAVAGFSAEAMALGSTPPRVLGTSAARDALNATELAAALRNASNLPLEVITGEQEADFAFRGVTSDPALRDSPLLILDVGGGSTEFIVGRGEDRRFARSFELGSVRLLEQFPIGDPPCAAELAACRRHVRSFLDREVRLQLEPALAAARRDGTLSLVGTGGATTILARMEHRMTDFDRARIEALRLSRDRVTDWTNRLWALPLAARKELPGLPPKRADVILFGAAIYEGVMECFEIPDLRVSTRGLRFGALMAAG
ncbi:MAG: Ppx/GppA family phosphatase [Verrucomicrobia bacterium]|nr:Ppx/GppA family phosphatase [Verrucomicrobiota bacterium]